MRSLAARLPTPEQIETEKAERHLRDFIRPAWPVIEPGTEYLHNWHIDCISEHLEAVTYGQITRLIVNIPPRNMKSILCSVDWPAWSWIKRPELRFLFSSYAQTLATKHNLDRRTVIQSAWYQQRWGDRFRLKGDLNLKTEFANDRQGHMISTSVGGGVIGKGGDILVVDDPLNPKMAVSDAQRVAVNNWFRQSWYSRLDDKKTGAIMVVMQRLHEQDLTGMLLADGGWVHLCLPAEAPVRQVVAFPVSGRQIVREPGAILWPEREGPKELAEAKKNLTSAGYSGQYQQDPSPSIGGILKRHWWRYWKPKGMKLPPVEIKVPKGKNGEDGYELAFVEAVDLPDAFHTELQSWDMSFKETTDSDFVAGGHVAKLGADAFVLRMQNARMDFPKSCAAVKAWADAFPLARPILIEDKANGPAVVSTLQHIVPGIVAVNPEGGKEARAHASSPYAEAGNIYLPHPALDPLTDVLIDQCAKLPKGANDDLADMLTQAIIRLYRGGAERPQGEAVTSTPEQLTGVQPHPTPAMRNAPPPALFVRR